MKLLLLDSGGAQLSSDDEMDILWASDNDPAFLEAFSDDILADDDVTELFGYLVEKGVLSDSDVEEVEVFAEDGEELDDDELEDDDDEDDDDEESDIPWG